MVHTRPPQIRLYDDEAIIDGFAGGGGTSTGIEMALGRSPDIAINHDPEALAMHEVNHPYTDHIVTNIRKVRYEELLPGRRVGLLWLSPDCTFHSKARGGKPFRDPLRARRIRGLAWEAVRAVKALGSRAPRVIIIENVEEWRDWCPLKGDRPDWSRRGENYRRFKRELLKAGKRATGRECVIEDRELVACDHGSPTKRKRLFVIFRSDGQPIVWPEPTHGPGRAHPYRTAAECIDFSLPVPSIFLTQKDAYAWAEAIGLPKSSAPRRPLATATKRRIARGVDRFVLKAPEPFMVNVRHTGHENDLRVQSIHEPTRTIPASDREVALVTPTLAPLVMNNSETRHDQVYRADEPIRTLTALGSRTQQLVTPFLAPYYTERVEELHARTRGVDEPLPTITTQGGGKVGLVAPVFAPFITEHANASSQRNMPADEPLRTICAQVKGGHFALVAPTLINTRNGEREGQAPRVMDIQQPYPTVTAAGSQGALVAATLTRFNTEKGSEHAPRGQDPRKPLSTLDTSNRFGLVAAYLAKHNAGHEATGQRLERPVDTLTCKDSKALVTSHLVTLRGGVDDHPNTSQDVRAPLPTMTAGGTHYAEVRITLVPRDSLDPSYVDRAVQTCAFLVKYFGTGVARPIDQPLGTLTTKDRIGLVQVVLMRVGADEFVLADIGMRMLTPRELFLCQGFPRRYEIEHVQVQQLGPRKLTKKAQTRLVGNSVPPHVAAALIGANLTAAEFTYNQPRQSRRRKPERVA
jgi:DNA (cytosine-5)-methyltransferase 1